MDGDDCSRGSQISAPHPFPCGTPFYRILRNTHPARCIPRAENTNLAKAGVSNELQTLYLLSDLSAARKSPQRLAVHKKQRKQPSLTPRRRMGGQSTHFSLSTVFREKLSRPRCSPLALCTAVTSFCPPGGQTGNLHLTLVWIA